MLRETRSRHLARRGLRPRKPGQPARRRDGARDGTRFWRAAPVCGASRCGGRGGGVRRGGGRVEVDVEAARPPFMEPAQPARTPGGVIRRIPAAVVEAAAGARRTRRESRRFSCDGRLRSRCSSHDCSDGSSAAGGGSPPRDPVAAALVERRRQRQRRHRGASRGLTHIESDTSPRPFSSPSRRARSDARTGAAAGGARGERAAGGCADRHPAARRAAGGGPAAGRAGHARLDHRC